MYTVLEVGCVPMYTVLEVGCVPMYITFGTVLYMFRFCMYQYHLVVARPNPKGAPSAARGASSWVADLEAYNAAAENIPPHCLQLVSSLHLLACVSSSVVFGVLRLWSAHVVS